MTEWLACRDSDKALRRENWSEDRRAMYTITNMDSQIERLKEGKFDYLESITMSRDYRMWYRIEAAKILRQREEYKKIKKVVELDKEAEEWLE